MWIGFVVGWVIASVTLYVYLVATAREPRNPECMDCQLTDCSRCGHSAENAEAARWKHAA